MSIILYSFLCLSTIFIFFFSAFFFQSSFSYSCYKFLFSPPFFNSSAFLFTVSFAFLLVSHSHLSLLLYNFQFSYSSTSIISLSLSLFFLHCQPNHLLTILLNIISLLSFSSSFSYNFQLFSSPLLISFPDFLNFSISLLFFLLFPSFSI